ncbi:MAG: diacylglycerol/polyprenol kinase family protein [Nanoarchaeota archaeon]
MADIKKELKRKILHLVVILYLPIYLILAKLFNHTISILILTFALIFFLVLDFFRIKYNLKIPFFHSLYREHEKTKFGGHVYLALGLTIAFAFLEFRIALTVLLMAIFGDITAALIGIKFGKHWLKKSPDKAWEGILAEFFVDLLIAILVLNNFLVSVSMAFVATFVETKLIIDDNFSIPVFTGIIGQILISII